MLLDIFGTFQRPEGAQDQCEVGRQSESSSSCRPKEKTNWSFVRCNTLPVRKSYLNKLLRFWQIAETHLANWYIWGSHLVGSAVWRDQRSYVVHLPMLHMQWNSMLVVTAWGTGAEWIQISEVVKNATSKCSKIQTWGVTLIVATIEMIHSTILVIHLSIHLKIVCNYLEGS